MSQKLFIVESPTKARKIESSGYLDSSWKVVASSGHIRDMPSKGMNVEAPDFVPVYEIISSSAKTVGWIRKLAASAESVWLATDDDREGEAIAWHLKQVIGQHQYHRVTFREVTKAAIQSAIQSPGQVNYPYVLAQQARRVIDRLAGYTVSPALRSKTGAALSAGRVQTPPTRMIVEREEAIDNFVSVEHYGLTAVTMHNSETPWSLSWDAKDVLDKEQPYLLDPTIPQAIKANVRQVVVIDYQAKSAYRNAPPPLVTSTLQQAGNNKLNLGVEETMKAAQFLFESGLITYHRTDDPNLSDEAIEMIHAYLKSSGHEALISETKNTWKSKEGSQDAHEAIRAVDFNVPKVDTGNPHADAIYRLIWRSAVCSQMRPAKYDTRVIKCESVTSVDEIGKPATFDAKGRRVLDQGWMSMMGADPTQEDADKADSDVPIVAVGQVVDLTELMIETKHTRPPARFTEASLVKALEKEGIGRPSTYASILSILKSREYISIDKKKLIPTDTGRLIHSLTKDYFSFAEIPFTRELEETLDQLAQGKQNYEILVGKFYSQLQQDMTLFNEKVEAVKAITPTVDCPKCDGQLARKKGGKGFFWGCANYPECTHTANDDRGKPAAEYACPTCNKGKLHRKKGTSKAGKKYDFWSCDQFRDGCKATFDNNRGKPKT